ncbi:MAG: YihY/virulence factor BrkB family protein [Bacteroidota bacterium]
MSRKQQLIKKIKEAVDFLQRDIWQMPLKDLPSRKSYLIRQLRIFILAFRGVREDELQIRASSLTYYTLLSIVPVVAMAFGIAQGFGLEAFLEDQLREVFTGREEVFNWIMEFANSMLETTQGGLVAGIGLVILLYTIIIMMVYVEETFNDIWQIKKSRPLARKVSDYFAMMFVTPLFLILSSATTVFLTTQLSEISQQLNLLEFLSPALMYLVNLVPLVLIWIVFTLVYMVMPNTNVKFTSALMGAIVAGSVFIFVQWAYIHFQVGVSRYNAIYGSFAALPLLLLWLRISWLIVLFGAEISYANQNVEHYEFEHEAENISPYNKKILALYVYRLIAHRFHNGEKPLTPPEISTHLEIPIKILRQLLEDLKDIDLISETISENHKENAYQPASDINKVSIRNVMEKLDHKGMDVLIARQTNELQTLKDTIKKFNESLRKSEINQLVKDV